MSLKQVIEYTAKLERLTAEQARLTEHGKPLEVRRNHLEHAIGRGVTIGQNDESAHIELDKVVGAIATNKNLLAAVKTSIATGSKEPEEAKIVKPAQREEAEQLRQAFMAFSDTLKDIDDTLEVLVNKAVSLMELSGIMGGHTAEAPTAEQLETNLLTIVKTAFYRTPLQFDLIAPENQLTGVSYLSGNGSYRSSLAAKIERAIADMLHAGIAA